MDNGANKLMSILPTKNLTQALFPTIRAKFASDKSFTLIELLIVIGILAILVAAIVVVLNPAQLLAQARDGKRQQDLSALNQALNTITALDQSVSFGTSSIVYTSLPDSTTSCATWNLPSLPSGWQYNCVSTSSLQNTNGTGWIPVNFKTTGVVSLASLPIDPVNTSSTGLYYTYVSGGSFQLASHFESSKYQATQGSDAMYTVGSNLNLAPFLSGLVGWWKFDETSGTIAYDSSGYGNNGTMYSSTTPTYILTSMGCKLGNCASFDGVGRYVDIPDKTFGKDAFFSVGLWFNLNLSGTSDQKELLGADQCNGFVGYYNNSIIHLHQDGGSAETRAWTTANLKDGLWHHIIIVFNGQINMAAAFLDGTALGQSSVSDWGYTGNGTLKFIGRGYAGCLINSMDGLLDDVRIYNRALSASEIQALYNATR